MNKADKERLEELLAEALAILRGAESQAASDDSGGTGDGPPG